MSQLSSPAIVLDTNVVLDWLLFADPSSASLAEAIRVGQDRWIATPAMRDELVEVLRRGLAASRGADPPTLLAAWDAHVHVFAEAAPLSGALALHCTDPDDQKFIDLTGIWQSCFMVLFAITTPRFAILTATSAAVLASIFSGL